MRRHGISVSELLIVILIIVLLVALLTPVALEVRRRARLSPCMTNMRQIHVAWSTYLQDYNDQMPSLKALVERSQAVFACPADPYPSGANTRVRSLTGVRGSYFYISDTSVLPPDDPLLRDLSEADPNHGILACVVHGSRISDSLGTSAWSDYKGIVLRLRRDGSIHRVRQTAYCKGAGVRGRCIWDLMTDARQHPARGRWCPSGLNSTPCD